MKIGRATIAATLLAALVGTGAVLFVLNAAPEVPALSAEDLADRSRPYVIKLHAQWCPACLVTKDPWSSVQERYSGRVRFVVFDFTTDATTEGSRAEAGRLGLDAVFEQHSGETGTVLVVDGLTKEVREVLHGTRDLARYEAAIDAAIGGTHD